MAKSTDTSVRHPYDKWLKKKKCTLWRGIDYHCQPHSMSVLIRIAAKRRGYRVSVLIDEGILTITNHGRGKRRTKK